MNNIPQVPSVLFSCKLWRLSFALLILMIYGTLFNLAFTYHLRLDFSSLYSASKAAAEGTNPYQVLYAHYLPSVKKLPANLNPPVVLWAFNPLIHLSYDHALLLWCITSFILGLIGANLVFKYAFPQDLLKKDKLLFYLLYLSLFSTIMNTTIAQFGTVIFFFIMYGYHLYLKKYDYFAGFFWGIIISFKLFPALLFFYVLLQNRYKVFWLMLFTTILVSLVPWLTFGSTIYFEYINMMPRVLWYGDSWNASIYGFIFRLLANSHYEITHLLWVQLAYVVIFCVALIAYLVYMKKIEKQPAAHASFCLTLVVMLLLSPLGWLYYFEILLLPLALTWKNSFHKNTPIKIQGLWYLCLFLLNFPLNYIPTHSMHSYLSKLSVYSFHFYGLLLLLLITARLAHRDEHVALFTHMKKSETPIAMIILFGLGVVGAYLYLQ
jgi:alpha-1,2-mannosyltransferase